MRPFLSPQSMTPRQWRSSDLPDEHLTPSTMQWHVGTNLWPGPAAGSDHWPAEGVDMPPARPLARWPVAYRPLAGSPARPEIVESRYFQACHSEPSL